MVKVAREMKRREMHLPLLIGGATTSRQHTAVKIAPEYAPPTVHVHDASRVAAVVGDLMDPVRRNALAESNRRAQDELRELYRSKRDKPLRGYERAVASAPRLVFGPAELPTPSFLGRQVVDDVSLAELAEWIDWTFFFTAWELRGTFPAILEHATYGAAARELFDAAQRLLRRIVDERLLTPRAVYGFWPAAADGDDIVVHDPSVDRELLRFCMLRQQQERGKEAFLSLADFVAPRESGMRDHVGAFACTAGIGLDALVAEYEGANDDYHAIMAKALADRLAEALAELLHARARRDWGYGRAENLSKDELLAERYRGIRPAFGYPACPDHTEKGKLFRLLEAQSIGMALTESFAMTPAASVSGIYLAHPDSRYFNLGRIGRDQVLAYAARKGMDPREVERWLGPNLGYDADEAAA
jgi:5-methyltetrahydrofolate--homocysteine methyltransferase